MHNALKEMILQKEMGRLLTVQYRSSKDTSTANRHYITKDLNDARKLSRKELAKGKLVPLDIGKHAFILTCKCRNLKQINLNILGNKLKKLILRLQ